MAPGSTGCYHQAMGALESVSQRDLRLRSKEIMDGVEAGRSYAVTRDGREIAELIPIHRKRRFIPVREFLAAGQHLPPVDVRTFLNDIRSAFDDELADPYDR